MTYSGPQKTRERQRETEKERQRDRDRDRESDWLVSWCHYLFPILCLLCLLRLLVFFVFFFFFFFLFSFLFLFLFFFLIFSVFNVFFTKTEMRNGIQRSKTVFISGEKNGKPFQNGTILPISSYETATVACGLQGQ